LVFIVGSLPFTVLVHADIRPRLMPWALVV
jgi:hypothetical protein